MARLLLLCALAAAACRVNASRRGDGESGESKKRPRAGTRCTLLGRKVLTEGAGSLPAIHQLRLGLPVTAGTSPACCGGEGGLLHVRVKVPKAEGQPMRLQPYSAHLHEGEGGERTFDLVVKVYSTGGPPGTPGVSAFLGGVAVGETVHVPEIRALDWRRDSRRAGMVCFGVGITECLGPAENLLNAGAEVRLVYASRNAEQIILRNETAALLEAFPGTFRVRHCLSQPAEDTPLRKGKTKKGERMTKGRVDYKVLKTEFGGQWADGSTIQHIFPIGSSDQERGVLGMAGRAQLFDFSRIRGHPEFLLMKGPHGENSDWERLSPPAAKKAHGTPTHDEV